MKKDTVQFQEVNQMFTKLIFCHYNFRLFTTKVSCKIAITVKKTPEFIFNNVLHGANYKCERRRKMTVVVYKI